MAKLVSFLKMPDNLPELLDRDDYSRAFIHKNGFKMGIFEVIHCNDKYPQWNNIIYRNNEIFVYADKKWKIIESDEIFKIFLIEYANCFCHVFKNKEKMYGVTEETMKKARRGELSIQINNI